MRSLLSVPVVLSLVAGSATAAEVPPELAKRLCEDRAACSAVALSEAGEDGAGRPLKVVELAIKREAKEGEPSCRPHLREFWIVAGAGAASVTKRLLRLCNDGYGAAGVGEDIVTVRPNGVVYEQSGGSAWRWTVTRLIQLVPTQVLSERNCSFWTGAPGFSIEQWDWRTFSGLTILRCQPEKPSEKDEIGCVPGTATHQYLSIPKLTGESGISATGAPALGSCAIELRDDGGAGFMVHGRPGPKGGAAMRLLLVGERDLLITVEDREIRPGRNWVHSDHVEIWQAGLMSIGSEQLTSEPLVQFGVRLTDGKVFAGYGRPKALPTVVAHRREALSDGRKRVSLRLRLPQDGSAMTVVYSKAVAGRQARMVATSPIRFGKAETLGGVFSISPKAARCAMRDGRVELIERGNIEMLEE